MGRVEGERRTRWPWCGLAWDCAADAREKRRAAGFLWLRPTFPKRTDGHEAAASQTYISTAAAEASKHVLLL